MKLSWTILFLIINCFKTLRAYNVDIKKPLIFFGSPVEQFGYATEILKSGDTERILIGAPANTKFKAAENTTGTLYNCPIQPSNLQTNGTSCDVIKPNTIAGGEDRFAATLYKNSDSIVICSPLRHHLHDYDAITGGCEFYFLNMTKRDIAYIRGRANETRAKGMYGFSVTAHNQSTFVLGGPNACQSDGGIAIATLGTRGVTHFDENKDCQNWNTGKYFGFALESFGSNRYVVGKPGFANEHGLIGMMEVIAIAEGKMERIKQINGKQIGGGFARSLSVADINGDGMLDIIVGAPFEYINMTGHSSVKADILVDVGRIYIFLGDNTNIITDKYIAISGDEVGLSRFGTSLSAIGDIDDDSFQDLAVGAPFEDEMRGAVYIFNGCHRPCLEKWKYSQKITARSLNTNLKGFGSYVSKTQEDIDANEWKDFAVGAYRSGNAVVLRTRPVISIEPKILFNENPVPLNSSGLPCAHQLDYPCLEFEVCFNMTGRGIHTGIYINFDLRGDNSMTNSRILINGNESSFRVEDYLLNGTGTTCKNFTGQVEDVGPIFFIFLNEPMVFSVNLSLSGTTQDTAVLPILSHTAPVSHINNVTFKTFCSRDEHCQPHLSGNLSISDDKFDGQYEIFTADISVRNFGDPSTATKIVIHKENSAEWQKGFVMDSNSEKVECTESNETVIICKVVTDPFYPHQLVDISLDFKLDPKKGGAKGYVEFKMTTLYIASGQSDTEEVTISSVRKKRSSVVSVGGKPYEDQKEVDPKAAALIHSIVFGVHNRGPSAVDGLILQISVPWRIDTVNVLNNVNFDEKICKDGAVVTGPNDAQKLNQNELAINCSEKGVDCRLLECKVKQPLNIEELDSVNIELNISSNVVGLLERYKMLKYVVTAKLNLSEESGFEGRFINEDGEALLTMVPREFTFEPKKIDLGIVIGGSVGGLVFLIIVGIVLWKLGFFKRNKRQQVDEYKRRTAIMKRQSRMSKMSAVSKK